MMMLLLQRWHLHACWYKGRRLKLLKNCYFSGALSFLEVWNLILNRTFYTFYVIYRRIHTWKVLKLAFFGLKTKEISKRIPGFDSKPARVQRLFVLGMEEHGNTQKANNEKQRSPACCSSRAYHDLLHTITKFGPLEAFDEILILLKTFARSYKEEQRLRPTLNWGPDNVRFNFLLCWEKQYFSECQWLRKPVICKTVWDFITGWNFFAVAVTPQLTGSRSVWKQTKSTSLARSRTTHQSSLVDFTPGQKIRTRDCFALSEPNSSGVNRPLVICKLKQVFKDLHTECLRQWW